MCVLIITVSPLHPHPYPLCVATLTLQPGERLRKYCAPIEDRQGHLWHSGVVMDKQLHIEKDRPPGRK